MDNLTDIKKLWLSGGTAGLPAADEIVRMAKKFRNQKLVKKVLVIAAALLLTGIEVWVVFVYKSTMVTTRMGEGLIIIAGIILVTTNTRSIGRFYRFNDFTNKEFVAFLEQTQVNQAYFYKKTQLVAFALCAAGLLLYPFEMVYGHPTAAVITYLALIIYLLVLGLVVRPRVFRKQARKLNETMQQLKLISKQLN